MHLKDHAACIDPPRAALVVPAGSDYHFSAPTPPNVSRTETITITNDSTGSPLTLTNPSSLVSGACFTQVSTPPSTLMAGQSANVQVRLRCGNVGHHTGTFRVQSTDPRRPVYQVTLRGQVANGTPVTVGLQASYQPRFGQSRTTRANYIAHDPYEISYFYDPNLGAFENRPVGVPCSDGSNNPTYFKIRKVGAPIDACRYQASWDANEITCSQTVVDTLNAGTEIIINTDDAHTNAQTCRLVQPLSHHVRGGEQHHMRVTLIRNGGEYRRQLNFTRNSYLHYYRIHDDTWVNEASPDANYGQQTSLRVRTQPGATNYSFLYALAQVEEDMIARSSRLLLSVGNAPISAAAVYEVHNPPSVLSRECHEQAMTWNTWQGCFPSYTWIETVNNIQANRQLAFDVTSALEPTGGVLLFGVTSPDTASNRTFGSGESGTSVPYLVTTSSQ